MARIKKLYKINLFFFILFLSSANFSWGQDGGFSARYESTYFSIYLKAGIDPLETAQKIDLKSSEYLLIKNNSASSSESPQDVLSGLIDAIFMEASDILDIHLYSFKGNIKIYPNLESLNRVYKGVFSQDLKAPSFYVYEKNTIYISQAELRLGILAHEMAHAIISNYFAVAPPVKIQEVLAGYVEYQLNKKSK